MTLTAQSSNVINTLKCFLCLGVVFVHGQMNLGSAYLFGDMRWREVTEYHNFRLFQTHFVSDFCDQVCVPVFFLLSGFLFFLKVPEVFKTKWFINKYKSRIRSLLIPYLIANAFFIFVFIVYDVYRGNTEINILNILKGFWANENGYPADLPLWFLRDLLVVVFFTPLIYYGINKISFVLPLLFGVWFVSDPPHIPIISISGRAFFFFSVGACFAIKGIDFIEKLKSNWTILVYWAVYFTVLAFYLQYNQEWILRLSVIPACPALVATVKRLSNEKKPCPHGFAVCTFFIYLYHYYIVMIIWRLLLILFGTSELAVFVSFFMGTIMTVFCLYFSYLLLYGFFPKIISFILGGR